MTSCKWGIATGDVESFWNKLPAGCQKNHLECSDVRKIIWNVQDDERKERKELCVTMSCVLCVLSPSQQVYPRIKRCGKNQETGLGQSRGCSRLFLNKKWERPCSLKYFKWGCLWQSCCLFTPKCFAHQSGFQCCWQRRNSQVAEEPPVLESFVWTECWGCL